MIPRHTSSVREDVFPRLLYSHSMCSQSCGQRSQACHQCSQVIPGFCSALPGAARSTWRPLYWSSNLWDLTTLGFCSDNSQTLPVTKIHIADARLKQSCYERTIQWQPSATSLCPTLDSKGWMKFSTCWALTLGNRAKCDTNVWPTQTTFPTIITHVSFTSILWNALSSSCNSLHSGNICCMLQQRNSMMLRNASTQRWNQVTGGGMNRNVSWIASQLWWF